MPAKMPPATTWLNSQDTRDALPQPHPLAQETEMPSQVSEFKDPGKDHQLLLDPTKLSE